MKRLKNILPCKVELLNNLYLILISFIFLWITIYYNNIILLIITVLLIIIIFIYNSKIGLILGLILSLYLVSYILLKNEYNCKINNKNVDNSFIVVEKNTYDDYIRYKIKENRFSIFKYYIYLDDEYNVGDVIYLKGSLNILEDEHSEYGFNYLKYAFTERILGSVNVNYKKVVNQTFVKESIHYNLINYVSKYYNEESTSYISCLVLGDKTLLEDDLKDNIVRLGISHLFVVSGLHVSIITFIIKEFLSIFKLNDKIKNISTCVILLFYLIITNFGISVERVFMSEVLSTLFNKKLTGFNKFSLNILIVGFLNPFKVYSYSFILTYLISGNLILLKNILNKFNIKNKILNYFISSFIISIFSTLISLPIVSNINGYLNILSIINNLFYIPFISFIILPLSILAIIFPFISIGYEFIINILNCLINFNSNFNINIILPHINIYFIIIYYLLYYLNTLLIENNNRIKRVYIRPLIYLFFIVFWVNNNIFNLEYKISFINLKKGESILIEYPFNNLNILIDTSIDEEVVSYLTKHGINRIDYLIITHSDSDHVGMVHEISDVIKIKNIIFSIYDDKTLEYVSDIKCNKYKISGNNEYYLGKMKIKVFNPTSDLGETNLNSLCFISYIDNLSILFTGDIPESVELSIIKNNIITVDLLKIGHHGSKYSSSLEFLKSINFKIGIGCNGYKNGYDFPSSDVIERFKLINKPLYNTIDYEDIIVKKYFFLKNSSFKVIV